jgi:hypothetical protein
MTHVLLTDDFTNKRAMLLAMLGHFMPELWKNAARSGIEEIGRFAEYEKFKNAAKSIKQLANGDPSTLNQLKSAEKLKSRSIALCASGKYAVAIRSAEQVRAAIIDAYCLAQKPTKGKEHRAWWCHSAFGIAGITWNEAIKQLKENGFTAILPNMLWGGTAYYICKLIEQIKITRKLKTGGFTIFNYSESEFKKVLPLCGKGITRDQK